MAYLGRGLDKISNIEVLDNITFDGSSSYSITKGSVAFTPNSAQSCLISIDGIVQATNFTVNSSTIDFGVAIPSTSVCNFFLHYGTGVMTVPSDGSVTTAKLGDNAVTTAKITDANVTSAKMFSGFKNGITEADQWRVTATQNYTGTSTFLVNNWERNDTSYDKIGTGMTETSGVFSFPSTGIYHISFQTIMYHVNSNTYAGIIAHATNDNSTYYSIASAYGGGGTSTEYTQVYNSFIFDVTNTSNDKIKLKAHMRNTAQILGESNGVSSGITFIKLGDT